MRYLQQLPPSQVNPLNLLNNETDKTVPKRVLQTASRQFLQRLIQTRFPLRSRTRRRPMVFDILLSTIWFNESDRCTWRVSCCWKNCRYFSKLELIDWKLNFNFFKSIVCMQVVRCCPKKFVHKTLPIFGRLLLPNLLTWSVAEKDLSLHSHKKFPDIGQKPSFIESNTIWKKPIIGKVFLESSIEECSKKMPFLPVMTCQFSQIVQCRAGLKIRILFFLVLSRLREASTYFKLLSLVSQPLFNSSSISWCQPLYVRKKKNKSFIYREL